MTASSPAVASIVVEPRLPATFEELLSAHRRELLVHCYRMLGSWTDAEDVMQDVSLRAWRALPRFEGRSSARAWLYRIATNACLSARKIRSRRTLPEISVRRAAADEPPAPPIEDARWIQPLPTGTALADPAASRDSVTLAFVLALQQLPPRQRAALLLRDVVGYEAGEVASMLKSSTHAVNSALVRARARMERFRRQHGDELRTAPLNAAQQRLLRRYVEAWEAGDVDAIVALLRAGTPSPRCLRSRRGTAGAAPRVLARSRFRRGPAVSFRPDVRERRSRVRLVQVRRSVPAWRGRSRRPRAALHPDGLAGPGAGDTDRQLPERPARRVLCRRPAKERRRQARRGTQEKVAAPVPGRRESAPGSVFTPERHRKRERAMCPACLAAMAPAIAGAASGTGVLALAVRKLRGRRRKGERRWNRLRRRPGRSFRGRTGPRARKALLHREKQLTRERDELARCAASCRG